MPRPEQADGGLPKPLCRLIGTFDRRRMRPVSSGSGEHPRILLTECDQNERDFGLGADAEDGASIIWGRGFPDSDRRSLGAVAE